MIKLLTTLTLVGLMIACKDNKEAEEKPGKNETTNTTNGIATGVPTFSDPEVQKYANEYAVFMGEYKTAMADPTTSVEFARKMQDWSTRTRHIAIKLVQYPRRSG